MKFRKHLLLNKVDDEMGAAGGGASGNDDLSGGDNGSTGANKEGGDLESTGQRDEIAKLKADFESQMEAMRNKNSELLNKLSSSNKRLQEIEDSNKEAEMKKLKEEGDLEKILEIKNRQLEELKQFVKDNEEKELAKKEELLYEARVAEFKKRMGDVDFHDFEEAVKAVDLSKFIMEDTGWNEVGIKQAIEDFKTNKHYHFKSKKPDPNAEAPGGKKHKKESSYQEFLKELAEE